MIDPDGAEYVIESNDRSFAKNQRTVFLKILKKAKVEPWGKPFQNLRSSRETELAAVHPIHVVVAWLGNSIKVAKEHYLQVTDADFEKAITKNNAQNNAAGVGESQKSPADSAQDNVQKEPEFLADPTNQALFEVELVPPTGFEPVYQD